MATAPILKVLAWGQYVHWADLQFGHFRALTESDSDADRIGICAHWLASENAVVEGWHKLGLEDVTITELLSRYPEHCDMLRRCRNAVYHFQPEMLDQRITACLTDSNEELTWSVALHFEFQRFLLHFPYYYLGTWQECNDLAVEVRATIGWLPKHSPSAKRLELYEKCMSFLTNTKTDTSQHAADARAAINASLQSLTRIDTESYTRALSRMQQGPKAKSDA
jgi:hypothetical protein